MNTDLEPPRVPPLTAAEHARMRNQLMDTARPAARRPARHWVAPVVGVAAVAAVVAGTLVVANRPSDDAGVAGTSTPQASPQAKVGVDLGAVPQRDVAKLITECQFPDEGGPAELVWSRHVRGISKDSTTMVAVARNTKPTTENPAKIKAGRKPGTGGAPSWAKLGYRYCMTRMPPAAKLGPVASVGRVGDEAWRTEPTPRRGLVALGGSNNDFTQDLHTLQAWAVYRALPSVATVEARYVLDGQPGPWTKGVVEGGFAYTEVQARGKFTVGEKLTTEVRAFDAQGKQIPVG
ncbi:hypothetical protein [Kribbella sp. NPDC003557]|uniref:hypothetical protein n=1 Tax=Kribbella sp. NPDC003557 TaxID=3154449 RepID=UPI0033A17D69